MSPPQLSADAPVAQVLHPSEVVVLPPFGDESGPSFPDRFDRRADQGPDLDEPLQREPGLDDGGATRAMTDGMVMVFDLHDESAFVQFVAHGLAGLESVLAHELTPGGGDPGVFVDHFDRGKVVALRDVEVEGVVGGRDFHRSPSRTPARRLRRPRRG